MKKMMKTITAWILTLAMALSAAGAFAEEQAPSFEELSRLSWSFCSGVGAWSTDLVLSEDGTFTGEYHDSEMGETGEGYPDGTCYECRFSGRMSIQDQGDEYSRKVRIDELTLEGDGPEEEIIDGIRYVRTEPYGISEGDIMLLYRPGTPVETLPEDMLIWTHIFDEEEPADTLGTWFLMSAANESGFVGYEAESDFTGSETLTGVSIANPWEELTAEQMQEASGFAFGVPEGAENVIYRYLREAGLAEMQFTREGCELMARIQPAAAWQDISGMYYSWENEEEVVIHGCTGILGQAMTESGEMIERCMWLDTDAGRMLCIAVVSGDLNGLDLTVLAEQVYGDNAANGNA